VLQECQRVEYSNCSSGGSKRKKEFLNTLAVVQLNS